jgi:hypothetical protein
VEALSADQDQGTMEGGLRGQNSLKNNYVPQLGTRNSRPRRSLTIIGTISDTPQNYSREVPQTKVHLG